MTLIVQKPSGHDDWSVYTNYKNKNGKDDWEDYGSEFSKDDAFEFAKKYRNGEIKPKEDK